MTTVTEAFFFDDLVVTSLPANILESLSKQAVKQGIPLRDFLVSALATAAGIDPAGLSRAYLEAVAADGGDGPRQLDDHRRQVAKLLGRRKRLAGWAGLEHYTSGPLIV